MRFAPLAQGVYFLVSGLWPVVHLRSFERVTGPKVDGWLVTTFGALVASVGAGLVVGAFEQPRARALRAVGLGSAAVLALSDCVYVAKGRISPIYLGDLLVEAGLIASWLVEIRRDREAEGQTTLR